MFQFRLSEEGGPSPLGQHHEGADADAGGAQEDPSLQHHRRPVRPELPGIKLLGIAVAEWPKTLL